ncbi:hypothetical protein [Actinocatenispora thailandica]|uniref:hypothetical protein n=1 Tax=Actinocatenispora thailandica TaxID=227318 RepID=UPI00195146C4|nr:hypothetical protein [Actinocatenispora thailandica]
MSADGDDRPATIAARWADLALRFAAGRLAAAGHPDRYPEWRAELAELSAADTGGPGCATGSPGAGWSPWSAVASSPRPRSAPPA